MTKPQKHKYVVTLSIETADSWTKKKLRLLILSALEALGTFGKVRVRSVDMD